MTYKRGAQINRVGEKVGYKEADYSFVFSDNIKDWQTSRSKKFNQKHNGKKKAKALLKQKSRAVGARAQGYELETVHQKKHPQHRQNTQSKSAKPTARA